MAYLIRIRQLRAYNTLMQTGSMTRAAELLNLSQPTISRQLALLEEAVGFPLFDRMGGGRIVATDDGKRFFRAIEGTLLGLEELPRIAHGIRAFRRVRLRIVATTPLLHSGLLISALDMFCRQNPDVQLRIEWSPRNHIESVVVSRQADIGVAALPTEHRSLATTELLSTEAVAVVPTDHDLAGKEVVGVDDIPRNQLVLDRGRPLVPHFTSLGAEWPQSARVQLDAQQALTGLKLVAAGQGLTICDPLSATSYPDRRLKLIRWQPAIELKYGYFLAKGRQRMPIVDSLASCLKLAVGKWAATVDECVSIRTPDGRNA